MSGEELGIFLQKVMADGALDAYYTPIIMKKNRPAYQLTLICKINEHEDFERTILTDTSTFGIRTSVVDRSILNRRFESLSTNFGALTVKLGFFENKLVKITPEFESVKMLAKENNVSFTKMYKMSNAVIYQHYELS